MAGWILLLVLTLWLAAATDPQDTPGNQGIECPPCLGGVREGCCAMDCYGGQIGNGMRCYDGTVINITGAVFALSPCLGQDTCCPADGDCTIDVREKDPGHMELIYKECNGQKWCGIVAIRVDHIIQCGMNHSDYEIIYFDCVSQEPPRGSPTIRPKDPFMLVETDLTLTCDLSSLSDRGWPIASEFMWWKDEMPLPESGEMLEIIEPASVDRSAGYRCKVKNDGGSSNSSEWSYVTVGAPALVEDPLGKLILQPTMFDKSFSFNFTVSGTNLGPFIIKNGSKTMTNETFTQELSLTTGNFHYGQTTATLVSWRWDVTRSDLMKCENVTHYNGNYKFVASDQNPVGSSVDSTDFIIESFYRPLLSESGKSIGSPLNVSLDLECQACANPPPYGYSWNYKGGTLPDGVVDKGRFLEVANVTMDHFGNYTCFVYNNISGVEEQVSLNVEFREEGSPHDVINLQQIINETTCHTITISWTNGLNGGLDLLYHEIEHAMDDTNWEKDIPKLNCTKVGITCNYRIEHLKSATKYRIRVRPVNSHPKLSLGQFSYLEAFTMKKSVKVTSLKVTEEYIEVYWTFDHSSKSDIKVQVMYKAQNQDDFQSTNIVPASIQAMAISGKFDPTLIHQVLLLVFEMGLDKPTYISVGSTGPDSTFDVLVLTFSIFIVILIVIVQILLSKLKKIKKKEKEIEKRLRLRDEQREFPDKTELNSSGVPLSIEITVSAEQTSIFTEADITTTDNDRKRLKDPILEAIADELRENVEDCMIDMSQLDLVQKLGHGNFAEVYMCTWRHNGIKQHVAVKTLKENKSKDIEMIEEFLWEGVLTYGLRNPHVMSAHGVAVNDGRMYIILPFMGKGDLSVLLKHEDFTVSQLTGFCLDAAKGMRYMERKNYIHRDMAARNLMVDDNLRVRVADFGMASELLEKDYFRLESGRALPIRWLAPECLRGLKFSIKSDVWSFGITMWEIYNKARKPYENYQNHYIKRLVTSDRKYPDQELCPESVYRLMKKCWSWQSKDRPGFREIVRELEIIMDNKDYFGADYVNEELTEELCPSFNGPDCIYSNAGVMGQSQL